MSTVSHGLMWPEGAISCTPFFSSWHLLDSGVCRHHEGVYDHRGLSRPLFPKQVRASALHRFLGICEGSYIGGMARLERSS